MELIRNSEDYTDSDNEDSGDKITHYTETTLDEFYPNFDKYNIIIDGIRYPIFRKTVVGLKCMICKRSPDVQSIEPHIALDSHKNRSVFQATLNKLKAFHDFWMKEDGAIQLQQKYFHRMKCMACDVQLDFDTIHLHIMGELHQRMITLPIGFETPVIPESSESLSYYQGSNNTQNKSRAKVTRNDAKQSPSPKNESNKNSEHNIKLSVVNPKSSNILNRIPLRYKKHAKFLTIDGMANVFCKCCSKVLKNDVAIIKEHFNSDNHLKASQVPKHRMKFFCEICIKRCTMESAWDNHLVDLTHIARFNNLAKSRQANITEHECLTCGMVIFGDQMSLRRHKGAFAKKKPETPVLPKAVLQLFNNRNSIIQTSEKLVIAANEASNNRQSESDCCTALVRALREVYPKCKAYPFGSRVTGLGYRNSDLDVFLDIGDMYSGTQKQDQDEQTSIVNKVARTLQRHRASFNNIHKVSGARTPIVQVFHEDSEIDCDISFRHGLSVENTAFIRLCLDMQSILKPTMLYLKQWYAVTNLGGLSSYALTMLMIFYLQSQGYLLSVKQLRQINTEPSHVIDGWETIKYTVSFQGMMQYVSKCEYTVTQLMENFFEYYAKFDFDKWVICPLMGHLILKTQFDGNGSNLPQEMSTYIIKLYGSKPEHFKNLAPMCVQDPFDLSHNITKGCLKDFVKNFQAYCNLTKLHISALN